MKDFMLIFLGPDYENLGMSPDEVQGRMGRWFSWHEKMIKDGVMVEGNALTSTVKRMSGADMTVTDVAASEIKELVGGYYVVKAKNFDDAMEIAKGYPDFDVQGTVEIREVMVFDQ